MSLWKVVLWPDRRQVIAAMGTAMAILLPVTGVLVLAGLEPVVDGGSGWMVYGQGEPGNGLIGDADEVAVYGTIGGYRAAAYLKGGPVVEPGTVRPISGDVPAGMTAGPDVTVTRLVSGVSLLAAPGDLQGVEGFAAWRAEEAPGWMPARGADGFESQSSEALQGSTAFLILVSLPAVILVAAAFGDQEARDKARMAATLGALGRPRLGRLLVAGRIAVMVAFGVVGATVLGFMLWWQGGATFRPADTPKTMVALALVVPGAIGALAGMLIAYLRVGQGRDLLRSPPSQVDVPSRGLSWLPVDARPIVSGTRILPFLALAAMLFVVDVGFPLAAAEVPAAVSGQAGEWIIGTDDALLVGDATDAAPADVLAFDPAVDAALAEIVLPTTIQQKAAILRAADWDQAAKYHGLKLVRGTGPADAEIALGEDLAKRLGAQIGDRVWIQSSAKALVEPATVVGVYRGPPLLEDEGFLSMPQGQRLGGLGDGESSVLRVRPATQAALAAANRDGAHIEVTSLTVPDGIEEGALFHLRIGVANLGPEAGTRALPVRIDGVVVATATANLGAYQKAALAVAVIAPSPEFSVQVNPEAGGSAGEPLYRWGGSDLHFDTSAINLYLSRNYRDARDHDVRLYDSLSDVGSDRHVARGTTDSQGNVAFPARPVGTYHAATMTDPPVVKTLHVSSSAFRHASHLVVEHVWTEPSDPAAGAPVTVFIQARNIGGQAGSRTVDVMLDGQRVAQPSYQLEPGRAAVQSATFVVSPGATEMQVGSRVIDLASTPRAPDATRALELARDATTGDVLQQQVADRVLGDARRTLAGLGAVALSSTLAVVYLASERALRGRVHVVRILEALGHDGPRIRRRVAWEAGTMAAIVATIAVLLGKVLFRFLGWLDRPLTFGHGVLDPFDVLTSIQAIAAFTAVAAWAAYLTAGRLVRSKPL